MNMTKKTLFIGILLILFKISNAQIDTVKGYAPSYKSLTINVFIYKNFITDDTIVIQKFKVDTNGFFIFTLNIPQTQVFFLDLDYYYAFLYAEPNTNYNIILPVKKERSDEEKLNPFFAPAIIPAIVKEPENALNNKIVEFNNLYSKMLKKTLWHKEYYDTAITQLTTFGQLFDNQYFKDFKKFKIASFKYYIFPQTRKNIIKNYLADTSVLYKNVAYIGLLKSVIENFFDYSNDLIDISAIYKALKNKELTKLKQVLQNSGLFAQNQELIEITILKGLYDLYYNMPSADNDIIAVIEKLSYSSEYQEVKDIAQNLYIHFTTLKIDYPAPDFNLPNKKNKYKKLKDFQPKFIYLQFCHSESYACQKQIILLKKFSKTKPKSLEIITIFVADSISQMKNFITEHKCKWTFLFWDKNYNQKNIMLKIGRAHV